MDSGKGRKRPWEGDSPIESQHVKRLDPSIATVCESTTPLHYSRDSETLGRRTLPPLHTPNGTASAGSVLAASTQLLPAPLHRINASFRPRSQSLFDISLQPPRQWSSGIPAIERDRPPPTIGRDAHRRRLSTGPAPHAAGGEICCLSGCRGQECLNARTLIRSLAAELVLLHSKARLLSQKDYSSPAESPDFEDVTVTDSLQWTLDLAQRINLHLQDHVGHSDARSPDATPSQPATSSVMRRGQEHLEQREEESPPTRQYIGPHHSFTSFTHPLVTSDQTRSSPYGGEFPPYANSPHHTTSSSGSISLPPQSPMHAPQPPRTGTLPSPSSLNLPNITNLPSISPPSTAVQASAQATHLHDLQHQISVKTLTFQTLQREYESLLQKLERQRTKCATLEKKFEVSDVEINSLTDEKEKLQAQVAVLENQIEELQQSRDETRKQLVANGTQYMRIMEMANRLQAQSADDKKRWEAEKAELQQRIKVLEEAMVADTQRPTSHAEEATFNPPPSTGQTHTAAQASASLPSVETINVLRAEIGRLRIRTQGLETALQTMGAESMAIQEAAKNLVESGAKIENAAQGAMGG